MLINLINKSSAKIILFLETSPGRRYLRKEIREKTEINNIPLDNSLAEMLNFKLIERRGKLYSLNLENPITKQILEETREINTLPLKIKFLLLDFTSSISKFKGVKNIILFGSYSKLIFTEKSDIDIAIIFETGNEKARKKISNISNNLSKKYNKTIQEHFILDEEQKKHKKDAFIKDVLQNGKALI